MVHAQVHPLSGMHIHVFGRLPAEARTTLGQELLL